MSRRKACWTVLAACLLAIQAHGAPRSLDAVVSELAEQGDRVVYSTSVIDPATTVDLVEVSVSTLDIALQAMGLSLGWIDGYWVITPVAADHAPISDPPDHATQTEPLVESIIVTGSRHRLAGRSITGSLNSLDADDLATIPSLGSDGLRAAVRLPGMSSVGVSGKPRIRGGVQDELLVRVDGVELLDAYHLADFQSIFSVIDDRTVEAVDVYTGGFPARYGNRMSGVMDIVTGRPDGAGRTELGLSMFATSANTLGSLANGRFDYLASVRRSNLAALAEVVDRDIGEPRYNDAYLRAGYQLDSRSRFTIGTFVTRDDVTANEDDETTAHSNIDSRYLWSRLEVDHADGLASASTLTYTSSDRAKRLSDQDEDTLEGGVLDYHQNLRKVAASSDWSLRRQGTLTELGMELEYGRSHYESRAAVNRGLIGTLIPNEAIDVYNIDVAPEGWSGGAYWSMEIPVGPTLTLQPGLRWDFQEFDPNGTTYHVSPRMGLRWVPSERFAIHLDAGRYHQPEALHELQAGDGEAAFFRPQSADHLIAGLDWSPSPRLDFALELYHKDYRRTKTRYENLFNPFVLVPELEPDRIAIDPERARARGLDLELGTDLSDRATATLHYSYMDAEDRLEQSWVPRRWSQRHTASAMFTWRGDRLTAAASLTWHSGWRSAELPDSTAPGSAWALTDVLNNSEMRDFVSVDVNVRRSWRIGRSTLTAFVSVSNLTNRNNVAGVEYDAELEDGLIVFEPDQEVLLPLVPSVGVLVTF